MPVITHCCLEPHGSVVTWGADSLDVYISTQSVSGIVTQMSKALGLPASKIRVHAQFEGGGFGSKLAADRWGLAAAQLSKLAGGVPVRLVVDRRTEQQTAGCRPSAYGTIKIGSDAQGNLTAWQATTWSTGGMTGGAEFPLPYILKIPNQKNQHTTILNNIGSARSMRAPRQPQACFLTMCAIEDLADKLGMDPLALVTKNLKLAGPRAAVYKEEFAVADGLMGWKKRWHPRNKGDQGPIRQGLGLAFHTWSGTAHPAACNLTINPDGSIVVSAGHSGYWHRNPNCDRDHRRRDLWPWRWMMIQVEIGENVICSVRRIGWQWHRGWHGIRDKTRCRGCTCRHSSPRLPPDLECYRKLFRRPADKSPAGRLR